MINVVFSTMYYPVAIGKYFDFALRRRDDVNLCTVGPWTSTWIPWNGGMYMPEKYSTPPDIPLSKSFCGQINVTPKVIESSLLPFKPDLWINADAGFAFSKPDCQYAVIATDPHVLTYDFQRTQADKFYNMQFCYSKPGDKYLPYCADPEYHSPLEEYHDKKEYDVCLIGLHYPNRTNLVNRLRAKGLKVYYDIGIAYHEYNEIYSKSKIALSWSSMDDLIARVFEGMLMAVPVVCNRVPDISTHFVDGEDYYGFDNIDEAEVQVHMALANYDDAQEVAWKAHRKVKANHLYDYRISDILRDFRLI